MSVVEDVPFMNPTLSLPLALEQSLAGLAAGRQAVVRARLEAQWPRLREILLGLYGTTAARRAWLEDLVVHAIRIAGTRPEALWQLDLEREHQPDWHASPMLGYCTYVDKFGGTLSGVGKRIPHLQELGVSYLHLLPFLKAGTAPNDGGFAVASYDEIEPALGTMDDLRELAAQLRAAGISLCSDFVLNHVSHEHPWARKALAGDASYRDFFHLLGSADEVAEREQHLVQIFPNTAPGNFTHVPALNVWVWTTFYPYQWDLNYANPVVFSEMSKALLELANNGIEAFRLDSTGFLWKRPGTNCMNQPEVHQLLQALRCLSAIAAPGVLLKAEAIMPTRDLPPYFGLGEAAGKECHIAYHASLMSASWVALAEQKVQILQDVLANTPPLPQGGAWMTYVRCHDDIGWNVLRPELDARGAEQRARLLQASRFFAGELPGSYARGAAFQASSPQAVHGTNGMASALVGLSSAFSNREQRHAIDRLLLLYALSLFVGDVPLIYMGDELAQANTSPTELIMRNGADGRELHRPQFDENAYALRHAGDTPPGMMFGGLCALLQARRAHQGIMRSTLPLSVHATGHASVLGLRRGERALGLFNFSYRACTIDLGELGCAGQRPAPRDLVDPQRVHGNPLSLPGYAALWLDLQADDHA